MNNNSERFIQKVSQTIRFRRMFDAGDRALVGVSGGPDSMALLNALLVIAPEWRLTIGIAHLNHQLRGDASDSDEVFVTKVAETLNLPIYTENRDVSTYSRKKRLSIETAAREIRYAFFNRVADSKRFNKIALGHHMDDNAEMIIMNLLRGSGPTGMAGIPPVRDKRIVRPLIDTTKDEIITYLNGMNLTYVTDKSNRDRQYLRNRVRHDLIPRLTSDYNPGLTERLHEMADIFRIEDQWMERELSIIYNKVILEQQRFSISFSIPILVQKEPAVVRRLVRRGYEQINGNTKRLTYKHVEAVRGLLGSCHSQKSIDLPRQIRAYCDDQTLVIRREKESLRRVSPIDYFKKIVSYHYRVTPPDSVTVEEVGVNLHFTNESIRHPFQDYLKNDPFSYMDAEQLSMPLLIRNHRSSDRFSPLGLGGRQTVAKYLVSRERKRHQRANWPIMESNGKVVWVVGYGIDERVKITEQTKRILKVAFRLA